MEFASTHVFSPSPAQSALEDGSALDDGITLQALSSNVVEVDEDELDEGLDSYNTHALQSAPESAPGNAPGILSRIASCVQSSHSNGPFAVPQWQALDNHDQRGTKKKKSKKSAKFRREADTNILSLKLGSLSEVKDVATGDPCVCSGCNAMFSAASKLEPMALQTIAESPGSQTGLPVPGEMESNGSWVCEFCGVTNECDLEAEEIPTNDTVDYLVRAAPARIVEQGSELVIFCVDISGSMCVTSEIDGNVQLRGAQARQQQLAGIASAGDGPQYFRSERGRQVTYVSRLQAVQAAITTQIEELKKSAPEKRVALISFASDIRIHCDGVTDPVTVAGDCLHNSDELYQTGQRAAGGGLQPVSRSSARLVECLYELQENGGTALGPAICVALGMADAVAGSKIIVCTDGLANTGVGALDELRTDQESDAATQIYAKLGSQAKQNGCSIDVVAIDGDGCDVENLGVMSEAAGGTVTKLDPTNLVDEFAAILAEPVLATKVSVAIYLHEGLNFREEDGLFPAEQTEQKTHVLKREIGNVTASTEYSVEFGLDPSFTGSMTELPFQTQIRFTRRDGSEIVRCISASRPVTSDARIAEANANPAILAAHVSKKSASFGQAGEYARARVTSFAYDGVMQRCCQTEQQQRTYTSWRSRSESLDSALRMQQQEERHSLHGDLDSLVAQSPIGSSEHRLAVHQRSTARRHARSKNDHLSAALLSTKSMSSTRW